MDRDYRLWQADYPIITRIDSQLQWDGQQFSGLQYGSSHYRGKERIDSQGHR